MGDCRARQTRMARRGGGVANGKFLNQPLETEPAGTGQPKMQLTVKPFRLVHESVPKVLPGIENKESNQHLNGGKDIPVRDLNKLIPPIPILRWF